MSEEIDINICDVLCSWNKLNSNDSLQKLHSKKTTDHKMNECHLVCENNGNNLAMTNSNTEIHSTDKKISEERKGKTFTCSTCYKQLSSRNSLRTHLKIHSENKSYCCEHCGKLFSHNATLVGHLTKFHKVNVETAHKCSVCEKVFCRKNALKIHMATHVGFKPFPCKICCKSFSQKITRDIHTLTHTGKYDYTCSECCRKFPTSYKLNYHLKSHDVPEYHCLLCMKQFTTKEALDAHCDSHNTTSIALDENNELCNGSNLLEDCLTNPLHCSLPLFDNHTNRIVDEGKILQSKANMKKHLCNFCGCNFMERKSLLHHIKMRHAVGTAVRHTCLVCQKSFSQKSKLIFHMKRHTEVRDL